MIPKHPEKNNPFPPHQKSLQTKVAELTKQAIAHLLETKKKKFEEIPWQNQFLPLIIKNVLKLGCLKNVNPGMSHYSGMIDIPKSEINKNLPKKYLPKTLLCEKQNQTMTPWKTVLSFVEKIGKYPVMCKPNMGERSSNVQYIMNEAELRTYFDDSAADFLVQEYCDYDNEFGISVEKTENGTFTIVSLVKKEMPFVVGDGHSSVETLIKKLSLPADQKKKIKENAASAEKASTPKKGEIVPIVRTASISLGTKIIDIRDQITPELETVISKTLTNYQGVHVGRYDIRANSLAEIGQGKFKIIEFNGTNGIPMHVYDDKFSVKEKYEQLETYFVIYNKISYGTVIHCIIE